jgi:hypothetical protein
MKTTVLLVVTPCNLIELYLCLMGMGLPHITGATAMLPVSNCHSPTWLKLQVKLLLNYNFMFF